MLYIFFVFLLFIISIVVHIIICRISSERILHAKAFIFIATFYLVVYGVLVEACQYWPQLDSHSILGLPFRISAAIIYILLVPIYLCFYVLTQLTSPSKKILVMIAQEGALSRPEIIAGVQKENFISTRLNDLVLSGCVVKNEDKYRLTAEGRKIARILNAMQAMLGRKVGG